MIKKFMAFSLLTISLCFGITLFGFLGILVEIYCVQGLDSALNWLQDFPSLTYPKGMKRIDGYHQVGHRIGMAVGLF